ncbi:hypothetical protein K469DRAFT_170750 [Zopfia rhizophila CBS 207.26]|uniref:Uncharacterized protein n=1 Tax=Zopfia rhizophila CBS 207.26 TaxID=1314779 RepID=A0A6A6E4K8_9PEZI|nr:hypothetical protein K469DRAFT_170750 [Zopfia rhizophila CBS 207.26]
MALAPTNMGIAHCFQHCKTREYSDSTYDQLVSCGGDRYSCYSDDSTCCNDDPKVFIVGSATVIKELASTASYSPPNRDAYSHTRHRRYNKYQIQSHRIQSNKLHRSNNLHIRTREI